MSVFLLWAGAMILVIGLGTGAGLMCQTTTSNLFKQWISASLPHGEPLLISADVYFRKTLYSSKDVYSDWVRGVCVCACTRTQLCVSRFNRISTKWGISEWFRTIPEARPGPSHVKSHLDRDYFPSGSAKIPQESIRQLVNTQPE